MIYEGFVTDFFAMQSTLNEAATAVAAENERTSLLAGGRRRSNNTLNEQPDEITESLDDDNSSDLTSSSPSSSPDSLSSWQRSRAPDTPKHKRRQQHHSPSRPSHYETPCKFQRVAANRKPLSASLKSAHRHGILRAGIPLDRKHRVVLHTPPRTPGVFVIKSMHQRAYQTITYERPIRPWVQRDLEAQRHGDIGDEVDAMMEESPCFYWLVLVARGCLLTLAMVGVVVLLLLLFVLAMGALDR